MISRRPNRRASSEKPPGPRKTIAAIMMPVKTTDSLASNRFGAGRRQPGRRHAKRAQPADHAGDWG